MRSNDDNRKFAYAAFQALQLPKTWKLEGTDTVRTETDDPDSEILYVGAVYMDLSTSGIKLKRYRVFYNTHSERLGIVEKAIEDFGTVSVLATLPHLTRIDKQALLDIPLPPRLKELF